MDILLTVTAGPHQGREFSFSGHDTFLVGRSKHAHFQLLAKDKYFSRIHFLVEVNPPCCRLVDMNSHNGTYVNDQRVRHAELCDGDRIKAGHTILRVSFQYEPGEHAEPSAERESAGAQNAETETFASSRSRAPALPRSASSAGETSLPEVPGYRLLRELGRGGMGVVYLAQAADDAAQVAVKTIIPAVTPTSTQVDRFLREANILRQLRHPNIVSFRDMGEANGLLFFAMDYVSGSDADQFMKQHGRLPVRGAVRLICQLLDALEYAHAQGFVHRDIKPANVLIAETAKGRQVKLADFGLARVYQTSQLSGLTMSGDIGGTVKFMPPEQITNYREVKPAADQYSAAATLYYLLTGKPAHDFANSAVQPLVLILEEDPISIHSHGVDIPEELGTIIHQAMARDPRRRFADVAALRQALAPFG